jgi:N-acetylmuramate 1-kinase
MDVRQTELEAWLSTCFHTPVLLTPVTGDASFRRYFRFEHDNQSYVAMDAPPDLEDCRPFVAIAKAFKSIGLLVPLILHEDLEAGFLVITDFGDTLFHHHLNNDNVDFFYGRAIDDLTSLQKNAPEVPHFPLPLFDYFAMENELDLFTEWFLEGYCGLTLNDSHITLLDYTYDTLLQSAVAQPQVTTHRDYHSRNLMVLNNDRIGIIDFQDAVIGPITYDLASMIRDCYIDWPLEKVEGWALDFRLRLIQAGLLKDDVTDVTFMRWFDLMGMQRHLKAIFIFARKSLRDQHHFYLQFIPRALNYVQHVAAKYETLQGFNHFLHDTVLPSFQGIESK